MCRARGRCPGRRYTVSWYNDWSCSRCGMCPLASKLVYCLLAPSLHACPLPRNYTDDRRRRRSRPSQKAWATAPSNTSMTSTALSATPQADEEAAMAWAHEAVETAVWARKKALEDGLDPSEEAALAREATAALAAKAAEDAVLAKQTEESAELKVRQAGQAKVQAEAQLASAVETARRAAEQAAEQAAAAQAAADQAAEAERSAKVAEVAAAKVAESVAAREVAEKNARHEAAILAARAKAAKAGTALLVPFPTSGATPSAEAAPPAAADDSWCVIA